MNAISDGNGGLYLRRSTVEKAVLGIFGTLLLFIVGAAWRELVSLHDASNSQKEAIVTMGSRISDTAQKSVDTQAATLELTRQMWELQSKLSQTNAKLTEVKSAIRGGKK